MKLPGVVFDLDEEGNSYRGPQYNSRIPAVAIDEIRKLRGFEWYNFGDGRRHRPCAGFLPVREGSDGAFLVRFVESAVKEKHGRPHPFRIESGYICSKDLAGWDSTQILGSLAGLLREEANVVEGEWFHVPSSDAVPGWMDGVRGELEGHRQGVLVCEHEGYGGISDSFPVQITPERGLRTIERNMPTKRERRRAEPPVSGSPPIGTRKGTGSLWAGLVALVLLLIGAGGWYYHQSAIGEWRSAADTNTPGELRSLIIDKSTRISDLRNKVESQRYQLERWAEAAETDSPEQLERERARRIARLREYEEGGDVEARLRADVIAREEMLEELGREISQYEQGSEQVREKFFERIREIGDSDPGGSSMEEEKSRGSSPWDQLTPWR